MKTFHLAALLSVLLAAPTVSAQDADSLASPTLEIEALPAPRAPSWRLDVLVPTGGFGWFTVPTASYDRLIATMTLDVRLVGESGHGAMVRPVFGTNLWGEGWGGDIDYVFRSRLYGDDVFGLGLDLNGGMTAAFLEHNETTIADGLAYGGNVGASLDLRAYNFAMTLGVQYRMLLPTTAPENGVATGPEHVLTFTFGGGFGFWG